MPAYVIYQGVVTDPERYEQYKAAAESTIAATGGRYIVRGGEVEVLEGEGPTGRVVVVEFPTMQVALDWYRSSAYTQAKGMRDGAADACMYVVDGLG